MKTSVVAIVGLMGVLKLNAGMPLLHEAKAAFGVQVLEERTMRGVPDVLVSFGIRHSSLLHGACYLGEEVRTDSNGRAFFEKMSDDGTSFYSLPDLPSEYYRYGVGERFRFEDQDGLIMKRWLPYGNIHTVLLQRVEHPIPLYVKDVVVSNGMDLTAGPDRRFSYDLVKGDWMPPFGKGEAADVEFCPQERKDFGVFRCEAGSDEMSYRYAMNIRFPGEGNGFLYAHPLPSMVLKVRTAPADGYRSEQTVWEGRDRNIKYESSQNKAACYVFRIRTVRDCDGRIASCHYGKMYTMTGYGVWHLRYKQNDLQEKYPLRGVEFTYYLNPTPNDRNLEYDGKHNLNKANRIKDYAP